MLQRTEREIGLLSFLDKADVQYPVYLWTEMASKKKQGNWGYILNPEEGRAGSPRSKQGGLYV